MDSRLHATLNGGNTEHSGKGGKIVSSLGWLCLCHIWPVPLSLQHRKCGCFLGCILQWGRSWLSSPQLPGASSLLTYGSNWSQVGHPSEGDFSCFNFNLSLLDQSLSTKTRSQLEFELLGFMKFKELSTTLPCWEKSSVLSTFRYVGRKLFSELCYFPELYQSNPLREVHCPFPSSRPGIWA